MYDPKKIPCTGSTVRLLGTFRHRRTVWASKVVPIRCLRTGFSTELPDNSVPNAGTFRCRTGVAQRDPVGCCGLSLARGTVAERGEDTVVRAARNNRDYI